MNDQHGYHMNLLAQNYGFATISQPHYAYSATHGIHQSFGVGLNEHENRSFAKCSSSQRHMESSHNQYETREDETTFDLCNDAHAQRSDENSEEDEPSEDDGESKAIESESDEDIGDLLQNNCGVNLQNQFDQDVSEMQNNDIPYFTTLENEEDIFISTRESEMKYCSVWSEDAKKDLEKDMCFSSKAKLKRAVTIWSLRKNKEFKVVISTKSIWTVRCKFYDSLGCPWFLRGRKVGGSLWKIGKYFNNHRCETEGLTTAFQYSNPGTVVEWKHEESMSSPEVKTFKFVFWAFKPCIDGFQTCRPVISVDGTHMYGKYEIKLLIAVGVDGNDNILPLAFAIVDKESKVAWKWFFRKLSTHVIKDREDICIISDRAKGILTSLSELWQFQEPRAFHRFCLRHLKSNFQSQFPNRDLSNLMWRAATAHQVRKFEALMWEIQEENREAYEYLMRIPLNKWTVSHDDGKRWGVLTTNLSESFNGLLKKARGLPVTAMVRLSLEQTVERYTRRCQTTHQLVEQNELWTSSFKMKWEKNYEGSKRHFVYDWNISIGVYEVRSIQIDGTGGNPHCVSLSEKKCDCEKWANLHFPCSHVMKVTERMGALARNFVSEHFTTENYVTTYSGSFSPIGHEAYWPSPSFIIRSNEFYRRPNRSRTTRIPNEMDRDPAVYGRACGLCRQTGHDRRRCPTRNQT
ncbi:hypothetical protein KY290_033495 [Solanum tuberosum]|uniref:SWIM-type domain-containing protein n=1 Tax=Solanum tuberosum TaxID=4113 RepID=A0ABQ7U0G9_SOLTU|nr:hypothetical protein KY289_032854 [Solanum tuberosum]KAH0740452.1 hypothetical protein KY290_033495 [Solanum tuberosum]